MSRNYGNGSRYMDRAAQNALNAAAQRGEISYQTAHDYGQRFSQFAEFARELGAKYMEKIEREHLIEYGQQLAQEVQNGDRSASSAQNLVSAVQNTIRIASREEIKLGVSPTKDCGIPERSNTREHPTVGQAKAAEGIQALRNQNMERPASLAELARDFGLRAEEASLLNAKHALHEAQERGVVTVSYGTKGGRCREVPITSQRQLETLRNASLVQGNGRSVIPPDQNYARWKHGDLRNGRDEFTSVAGEGFHGLRAEYAATRYEQLTGHPAPVNGGGASRSVDKAAREIIARELGHGRIDVTNNYLGGR